MLMIYLIGGWQVAEYASLNMGKHVEVELNNMGKGQEHDADPLQVIID